MSSRLLTAPTVILVGIGTFLALFAVVPLLLMLWRSLQDPDGVFIGLANYATFFSQRTAVDVIANTVFVAVVSTVITVTVGLLFALALAQTCVRFKTFFRSIALLPLLTPSLLSAMALTQLFGSQGYLNAVMMGETIYGPIGIVTAMSIAHFPHVFIILSASISLSDARLYEAARALGTRPLRTFLTVTLPSMKYGLVSAAIASFTLCVTDFGIPKVIGGQYSMLATEIYKQVVGQQNFQIGSVISMLLLAPAALAFVLDRRVRRRQAAALTSKAVPFAPAPNPLRDRLALALCALVALVMLAMILVPGYASFIKFWPYNLELTLRNYEFHRFAGGGWDSYLNSLKLAFLTATVGGTMVFAGAYLCEKSPAPSWLRSLYQMLGMFPLAVPGLVLGLSYVFFLNDPDNPLEILYGTMAVLVISTIVHYYTVSHLTAVTALRQLDNEFELVSDSLKVSRLRTFFVVTLPLCLPAVLDIWIYLFLSGMTTVSAAVFLYSHQTVVASITVINMDDAGEYAAAAAMAMVIVATCIVARCLHLLATRGLARRAQAWKAR
ncbi:MAG: putative 2-aminoethylphosphonate ABC transporter permease subunit [Hyphomicrobiaceae bacterium]|nr:putative 2-aminoethylphosphonate ABC transporter permease subunit [Hyphomicrobiaceae bacterium]